MVSSYGEMKLKNFKLKTMAGVSVRLSTEHDCMRNIMGTKILNLS